MLEDSCRYQILAYLSSPKKGCHFVKSVMWPQILLCNHTQTEGSSFLLSTLLSCQDAEVPVSGADQKQKHKDLLWSLRLSLLWIPLSHFLTCLLPTTALKTFPSSIQALNQLSQDHHHLQHPCAVSFPASKGQHESGISGGHSSKGNPNLSQSCNSHPSRPQNSFCKTRKNPHSLLFLWGTDHFHLQNKVRPEIPDHSSLQKWTHYPFILPLSENSWQNLQKKQP
nr:hypothetical protein Iba_scaffold18403CG0330 [Ipomoea batatas]